MPPYTRQRKAQASKCVSNSLRILPTVLHRPQKLVIAHRGASYHLPEHSLPAYRMALEMGADLIESDIIATADGHLIALHSVDLNVTTNVEQVFPNREPWFSSYANKKGYWTFNFTLDEISQLTLKQRLPEGRTTIFDNMFKIPSLEEVIEVVVEWNHEELPQTIEHAVEIVDPESVEAILNKNDPDILRHPSPLELAESGLSLGLRDVDWLFKEADLDLVQLLLEHMTKHEATWNWILPCYQEIKYDVYKVPGLVIQSFDGDALVRFHKKWIDSKDETEIPEPPFVLKIDTKKCHSERFWSSVQSKYQPVISAIAPDKSCLFHKNGSHNTSETGQASNTMTVARARLHNLAIHAWAERPEKDYLVNNGPFNSAMEETLHLFCEVGVEGIFSESVSTGVGAAQMGCGAGFSDPAFPQEDAPRSDGEGQSTPPFCLDTDRELGIYLSIIFFVIGFLAATLTHIIQKRREKFDREGRIVPVEGGGYSDDAPPSPEKDAQEEKSSNLVGGRFSNQRVVASLSGIPEPPQLRSADEEAPDPILPPPGSSKKKSSKKSASSSPPASSKKKSSKKSASTSGGIFGSLFQKDTSDRSVMVLGEPTDEPKGLAQLESI